VDRAGHLSRPSGGRTGPAGPAGPRLRRAALALALALVTGAAAAACGPSGTDDGSTGSGTTSSSTSSSSSTSGQTDDPDPTTEDPDPTTPPTTGGNDNPAIVLARLPVGGSSDRDEADPARQCAHVSWIVDPDGRGDIPRGTAVEITRPLFTPRDAFRVAPDGCGTERPNCVGYVFRTDEQACDLAVQVVSPVPAGVSPRVGFSGLVYCPRNSSQSCRDFVAAMADQQQITVELLVPLPPETTTTEPPPETTEPPPETTGTTTG